MSLKQTEWDIIVIGTGMGGSTIGYQLAKFGFKVLFIEKGLKQNLESLKGEFAELLFEKPTVASPEQMDVLKKAGRFFESVNGGGKGGRREFTPLVGTGEGGSSALFGMVMERFFPEDFSPLIKPSDSGMSSLEWPIKYSELRPFYAEAEKLYRVRGQGDPRRVKEAIEYLKFPNDLVPANGELFQFFQNQKGLNPYRLPMACEFVEGCSGCQGFLCNKQCKNDSVRVCLNTAVDKYGATVLYDCEVSRLAYGSGNVSEVVCFRNGKEQTFRGKTVILAAGALQSPLILKRSTSERYPNGLANDSGLVGKNLMRHFVDLYGVFVKEFSSMSGNVKQIGLNDFYTHKGNRFGSVQSFGPMLPSQGIVDILKHQSLENGHSILAGLIGFSRPVLKWFFDKLFSRTLILASVQEDFPYEYNDVSETIDGKVKVNYEVSNEAEDRIRQFRQLIAQSLSPYRFLRFEEAHNIERLAHACGTCRFGQDPKSSVLNKFNRAHEVNNLYVVDSSFFPTSGGTNPALTIAGNALRVAEYLKSLV